MKRDVLMLPLTEEELFVIASDNSGAIGEKEADVVSVSYETVIYYGLRVAVMECMAVGAKPVAIVVQNFVGDHLWEKFEQVVKRICEELSTPPLPITGSTESNFSLEQSALGLVVLGRVKKSELKVGVTPKDAKIAVIGTPLVGNEVMEQNEKVAPLSLFQSLLNHRGVYEIIPCGSKGMIHEYRLITGAQELEHPTIDVTKSAGPATCFLMTYDEKWEAEIKHIAGRYFFLCNQ